MGDHAIAPAFANNPHIRQIEDDILGVEQNSIFSLHYKLARTALLHARHDLELVQNQYESMVETGTLPVYPDYVSRRVKPALRAGREGIKMLKNVHATITRAHGLAQFMDNARIALLQFLRHHGAAVLPTRLARFELETPTKKRPSIRPVQARHGPRQL